MNNQGTAEMNPGRKFTRCVFWLTLIAWCCHLAAILCIRWFLQGDLTAAHESPAPEFFERLTAATVVPTILCLCGNALAMAGLVMAVIAVKTERWTVWIGGCCLLLVLGLLIGPSIFLL